MCGGGGSKKPAAPPAGPVIGYTYSPADNSNAQRQQAAIAPDAAGRAASYGSELAAAPAVPAMTGGK
jgi:hypothetical protein